MLRLSPFDCPEMAAGTCCSSTRPDPGENSRGLDRPPPERPVDPEDAEPEFSQLLAAIGAVAAAASQNEPENWPISWGDPDDARETRDIIDGLFREIARMWGFPAACARPSCRRANACMAERPACILGDSEFRRELMDMLRPHLRERLAELERAGAEGG